jgi:cyclophilin family peptidyl-prolyl cis-trans isomerase
MLFRWMLCLGLVFAASAAVQAQDQPATDPGAAPAAGATDVAALKTEFDTMFGQWQGIMEKMGALQLEYKSVEPAKRPEMEKQFNTLLAEGDALSTKIKAAAEALYKADPVKYEQEGGFIAAMGASAMNRDQYEEAARCFKILIDAGYKNKALYQFAGIAAFNIGELDKAEEYFKIADEAGMLDDKGKDFQLRLPEHKADWEAEKAAREKDAAAGDLPRVRIKTAKGDIVIELFENEAPNTVANFVSLAQKKFYDGTTFHRVLRNFMAQGGDPKGDGTGGPGYRIVDECKNPGFRKHFRGSLSMAKESAPDTGGSQFFITYLPTSHLDGQHTVFGRVIEGMDVAAAIQRRDPDQPAPPTAEKIISVTVENLRNHEYKPKTLPE